MASATLEKAFAMFVPQEILQMMCKYVDRSDLKSARLVCKDLNDAAEITLFRHIYLRRNMDSFCRLRMISSTPHLAKIVRRIAYSGDMLRWKDEDPDYDRCSLDRWCSQHLGQGIRTLYKKDADMLREYLTMDDLRRLYMKWCGHLHSQRLMQIFDIEEDELDDAFGKLPQLEEICFGPGYRYVPDTVKPIRPELFSSLGREMLVEPSHCDGLRYHVGQFTSMMAAAHKNKKRLKVIKALDLHWMAFGQTTEVSAMMTASMRHCEHFTVKANEMWEWIDGEVQIASMIHNAPHLQTIELIFDTEPYQIPTKAVKLSRFFVHQAHWPNLRSLQLGGFSASEVHLKELLAAHATSLQSLDLSNINLARYESNGKLHHSSWVEIILFLQESLNIHEMRFQDSLTNEGNENWRARGSETTYNGQVILPVGERSTFKDRVENYVVEGGEFPLPWPTETDESRWLDLLLDFRPKLDETWEFHEDRFSFGPYD